MNKIIRTALGITATSFAVALDDMTGVRRLKVDIRVRARHGVGRDFESAWVALDGSAHETHLTSTTAANYVQIKGDLLLDDAGLTPTSLTVNVSGGSGAMSAGTTVAVEKVR